MAVDASPVSGDTGSAGGSGSGGDPRPRSDASARGPEDARRLARGGWILAALAVVTVLLGLAIPIAPVIADDPVVSWPRAGAPAASTTLPLAPYRPLELSATVPCDALRAGAARPRDTTGAIPADGDALRTEPLSAGTPGRGLTVTSVAGRVVVTSSGAPVLDEPLPPTPCRYTVVADAAGTRVLRTDGTAAGDRVVADRPGLLVPQVAELATDAPGTPGLAATVHTDDRYASVPSALKLTLLVAHLLALAAVLVLAYRRWGGRGAGAGPTRPRLHPADGVVALVSAAWVLLSPMQNDDSWYVLMARGAGPTGYIGNQIYMFNATENPFVGSQYVMAVWGGLGDVLGIPGFGLFWMRCLALLLGLVTWWLLRTLLATALGRVERRAWVPWTLLLAHLAWFLPYGMALRPEVFIVPLSALALLLGELARRREAVGPLIAATAVAALSVTVSPSGLVVAAPLVVNLPWVWRWLVARGWRARIGVVAAVIAAGTIAIPVGFGDATLGDVLEATDLHAWYYITFPWYEEWAHYRTLLETGTWARRLPMLLTLVLLVVVSIGSGRRPPVGSLRSLTLGMAVTTAVALALLTPGPTKWVNHFGAVAAPATVLLALCMLATPLPKRPGALVSGASVALLAGATVLGFAGPNVWKPYSDRGQPFGDHNDTDISLLKLQRLSPHIGDVYLSQVWWWLGIALAVGVFAAWRRRHGRSSFGLTADRAVLVSACLVLAAGMLAVFVYAPLVQRPGWTVATSQVQALAGRPCGLANAVTAMAPVPGGVGAPVGPGTRTGDFALTAATPAPLPAPAPSPGGPAVWHDQVDLPPDAPPGATSGLGTLTTPWYPVPAGTTATDVVVPLAANDPQGHRITVQFGTGPATAPVVAGESVARPAGFLTARQWQEVPVELPTPRPTAIRLVAEDRVSGPDSSLAVGVPRLERVQPVDVLTTGRPVFADQLSAALWPCVNQVAVTHGIGPTPTVRLSAAENTPQGILSNPTYEAWGGTQTQSERTWSTVRIFSQVTPGGPPTSQWGNVDRIVYDHPTDGYDLRVAHVRRGGTVRLPTLAGESYSGREYLG